MTCFLSRRFQNSYAYVLCCLILSLGAQTFAVLPHRDGGWIPNTDGLILVPNAKLSDLDLQGLDATSAILFGTTFENSNLTRARFNRASINNVNFTNSIVEKADLDDISQAQLYSTASYKNRELEGISLLSESGGWDFQEQNLSSSALNGEFANANFRDANLTDAFISGDYSGAEFTDAVIDEISIAYNTLAAEQIYATSNYQAKDLRGIVLRPTGFFSIVPYELPGVDFQEQDLTRARLTIDAEAGDFSRAILVRADLSNGSFVNVNFRDADLTDANLRYATFDRANMQQLQLQHASLRDTSLVGTEFQFADLKGTDFLEADASQANFSNADLAGTDFRGATLDNAILRGASLHAANFEFAVDLEDASFDERTRFNQWTVFPEGFDASASGLTFDEWTTGDFDGNGSVDANDVDLLSRRLHRGDDVPESIVVKGDFILLGDEQTNDSVRALTLASIGIEDIERVRTELGATGGLTISKFDNQTQLDLFLARRRAERGKNDEWLEPMFDLTADGRVTTSDLAPAC